MIFTAQNILFMLSFLTLIAAIGVFIRYLVTKEHEIEKKERESEAILKQTQQKAAEILDKTVTTSEQLLSNVRNTNENITADFDKVLQTLAQKEIQGINQEATMLKKGYEEKISQMETTIDQNTATMLQNTAANLDKQMTTMTQNLLSNASKSEQMIGEKTQEMLGKIEAEVTEYKKKKMAAADQEVFKLIQKTYLEVLGKTLPADVNQELILKALEETKKEGVFDL